MLLECTYVYMRMRGPAVVKWLTLCMFVTVCGVCVCVCVCVCECVCVWCVCVHVFGVHARVCVYVRYSVVCVACVCACGVCACVCACACLCMYGAHHLSLDGSLQVLNSKRLLKDALIGSFKVQFLVMPTFTIC